MEAAWEAEKPQLQSVPDIGEIFDVVVSRTVSRDCRVPFERRRYSVPFAWVGRDMEVLGTAVHVRCVAAGRRSRAIRAGPRGGCRWIRFTPRVSRRTG